jgi:hypothetical protein
VKTLAASLHHFSTVKDSEIPCPMELKFLGTFSAASLHHFTRFIARFIPLPRSYTILRWCEAKQRSVSAGFSGCRQQLGPGSVCLSAFYIP